MKIKNIVKGKGNKYIIKGDKNITLYDDVIISNNILFKKELTEEEIEKYLKENYKYEMLEKIIKFINRRTRSKYEIDKELDKYDLSSNDKNFIKNKLLKMNLYNDSLFVDSYIHEKFVISNDGPNKIKKDLLEHKIDEHIIDEKMAYISNEDVIDKLTKIVLKKIRLNHKYSKNEFIKKMLVDLVNQGYTSDMIYQIIIDNYNLDDTDKLEKEFDKLYRKYVNKYEKTKLVMTIKQKLYAKGYKVEDINQIINKKI